MNAVQWLLNARPGDRLVYHEGYLPEDGHTADSQRMFLAAVDGTVDLLQERIAPGRWRYIAVRRAKPHFPPVEGII